MVYASESGGGTTPARKKPGGGAKYPAAPPPSYDMESVAKARTALGLAEEAEYDPGTYLTDIAARYYADPAATRSGYGTPYLRNPSTGTTVTSAGPYGNQYLTPTEPVKVETTKDAKARLVEEEREQRVRATGANIQGPYQPGTPSPGAAGPIDRMTTKEYNALSPKQKAAVNYNTQLVKAVRRDNRLAEKYDPDRTQEKNYEALAKEIFGEFDEDLTYAPEVLSLLDQIGFRDESANLNDFLGLNATISADDLKHLKTVEGPTVYETKLDPVELNSYQLGEKLATATQLMQEQLVQGHQILGTLNQTATVARGNLVESGLGGMATTPKGLGYEPYKKPPPGAYAVDDNSYFIRAFGDLADRENPETVSETLAHAQETLTPELYNQFLTYAKTRARNAVRYDQPLFKETDTATAKPLDPVKLLAALRGVS